MARTRFQHMSPNAPEGTATHATTLFDNILQHVFMPNTTSDWLGVFCKRQSFVPKHSRRKQAALYLACAAITRRGTLTLFPCSVLPVSMFALPVFQFVFIFLLSPYPSPLLTLSQFHPLHHSYLLILPFAPPPWRTFTHLPNPTRTLSR